eukprot:4886656-Prymnesium_polylepis.1
MAAAAAASGIRAARRGRTAARRGRTAGPNMAGRPREARAHRSRCRAAARRWPLHAAGVATHTAAARPAMS